MRQSGGATNVNLATIRDNSAQLLLKRAVFLSRIALLANPTANAADIEKYFGLALKADNYSYEYIEAPIKTLDAVVTASRELNFFELLQAVVLRGSLDCHPARDLSRFLPSLTDSSIMRQVLALGANLIDQYDGDSMLTVVHIPGDTTASPIAGLENIPYINEMFVTAYRPTVAEGGPASREKLVARINFEV